MGALILAAFTLLCTRHLDAAEHRRYGGRDAFDRW